MEIKKINLKELEKFTGLDKDEALFEEIVKNLWSNGLSSPNWCFIIEQKVKTIGRVGYWAPKGNQKEVIIFGLYLPWQSDNLLKTGEQLLKESFKSMQNIGTEYIDSQLDSFEERVFYLSKKLYKRVGLQLIQTKKRYKLNTTEYEYFGKNRLRFKPLTELKEVKYGDQKDIWTFIYVWIFVGPVEELLYRGFVQGTLSTLIEGKILYFSYATIIASIIFVLANVTNINTKHENWKSFLSMIPTRFIAAMVLGFSFQISDSLLYPIIIHNLIDGFNLSVLTYRKQKIKVANKDESNE